ncbi:MAG: hypothetical protein ABIQ70_12525, partial [Dokdonella sp.]
TVDFDIDVGKAACHVCPDDAGTVGRTRDDLNHVIEGGRMLAQRQKHRGIARLLSKPFPSRQNAPRLTR